MLAETGETLPVLLEINLGGEASKSGVPPEDAERLCEAALACPHLEVRGVMAVPPYDLDPEQSRPYFRKLRRPARRPRPSGSAGRCPSSRWG